MSTKRHSKFKVVVPAAKGHGSQDSNPSASSQSSSGAIVPPTGGGSGPF